MSPMVRNGRGERETFEVGLVGAPSGPVTRRQADDHEHDGFLARNPVIRLAVQPKRARPVIHPPAEEVPVMADEQPTDTIADAAWHVLDTLRRPLRARPVREPCVCGGPEIVAASVLDADVMAGVQRHQIEPAHIAHDERAGIPLSRDQLRVKALDDLNRELVRWP